MIYPANFEQKIGFDRLREQVAARCTMRAARARLAGETFSTSAREIARRLTLADEMRLLLDMEHEFPGGEYPDVDHIVAKLRVEGSFLDVEEVVTLHRALTVVGGIVAFILNREEQYPALHARSRGVAQKTGLERRVDQIVGNAIILKCPRVGRFMLLGSGHAEWCRVDDEVSGDVSALFPRSAQQTEFVAEGFRALFPAVGEGNIGEAEPPQSRNGRP